MNYLTHPVNTEIKDGYGRFTSREIQRQPATWEKTWNKLLAKKEELSYFLESILELKNLNIILTGAGSSAFVGNTAEATWQRLFLKPTRTVPTTDLITHFNDKVITQRPLLLISFARSGNSPESTAVINMANKNCSRVYHLIITCNADGELAAVDLDNSYVFLLPDEAEDQSLAMTNSFSSMLLTAITIPYLLMKDKTKIEKTIQRLCKYGKEIIDNSSAKLSKIAQKYFNRIIFLGSGPLLGIAKESHLKVQELTNGKVIGKYDTFLGFRHGPKAIINEDSLLVYLLSNRKIVKPYERDLVDQIEGHDIDPITLLVSESPHNDIDTDYTVTVDDDSQIDDDFWSVVSVLPAQIIGFYKSMLLNYNPDKPSPSGAISRVVEGVTIYSNEI